jgi:hypothetical protein
MSAQLVALGQPERPEALGQSDCKAQLVSKAKKAQQGSA